MKIHHEQLKKKGWSQEEIDHAKKLVAKFKRRKHPHHDALGEALYWALLTLNGFAAAAIAIWLTPLLILAPGEIIYPLLILIGGIFGYLFQIILNDLDHLTRKHHILHASLTPIFSLTIFTIIATYIPIQHNSLVVGLVYTISFLAPYLYYQIYK